MFLSRYTILQIFLIATTIVNSMANPELCEAIRAFEEDDKIFCAEQCSDYYKTCTNDGEIVEMPMPKGEKCYDNGSVLTSEGKCILGRDHDGLVLSFDIKDGCPNYPELDFCSTTVDEGSYDGVYLEDGIWYWKDQIIVSYFLRVNEMTGVSAFIGICFYFASVSNCWLMPFLDFQTGSIMCMYFVGRGMENLL